MACCVTGSPRAKGVADLELQADQAAWEDRSFTSRDGLQLHFRDYPGSHERLPLICLHGLTRNARDFEALAARYGGEYRVIALDFRGRGLSEWDFDPGHYTPITYAGDVIDLIAHLGFSPVILIGTSLGGMVTMLLAVMQPQLIAAAVLNDVGPELDPAGLARIQSYVGKGMQIGSWREAADRIAANHRHLPSSYGPDDWLRVARRLCREQDGSIVFDYDPAIALPFQDAPIGQAVDLWPPFTALARSPLLIVRGAESDLLPESAAEAMVKAAEHADLVTVPGVGHAPFLDEPEVVAGLDEFLNRHANPG
jgi:pimeloyl-ACP methyl ester carboxylesterase